MSRELNAGVGQANPPNQQQYGGVVVPPFSLCIEDPAIIPAPGLRSVGGCSSLHHTGKSVHSFTLHEWRHNPIVVASFLFVSGLFLESPQTLFFLRHVVSLLPAIPAFLPAPATPPGR